MNNWWVYWDRGDKKGFYVYRSNMTKEGICMWWTEWKQLHPIGSYVIGNDYNYPSSELINKTDFFYENVNLTN